VRTINEVLADPQLAARDMLVGVPAGTRTIKVPGNPIKLSGVPGIESGPAPALGEHTEEIRAAAARTRKRDS
jgi:CoA:oxalate CoA-transferase